MRLSENCENVKLGLNSRMKKYRESSHEDYALPCLCGETYSFITAQKQPLIFDHQRARVNVSANRNLAAFLFEHV